MLQLKLKDDCLPLQGLRGRQTRTLLPKGKVVVGYRGKGTFCEFLGFSLKGDDVEWITNRDCQKAVKLMDMTIEDCYVHFRECKSDLEFTCYRYNGRWVIGPEAEIIKIKYIPRDWQGSADDLLEHIRTPFEFVRSGRRRQLDV